ncbi:pyruvate dehydrogenase E1 subunit alpha 1b isoform X3 [Pundamilia nyererei]|uniref:Pyruvate dehydrogenase E1 subunit alpha 1b isoform X3 n=1 Tax=Pundamilia nyererei TaxID=303518 RepID=A0A9Y6SPY4_9CICH|nr:PREDICTED: uncharacterized protein LOC106456520 isoform X3 [Pundamilia nyererei]
MRYSSSLTCRAPLGVLWSDWLAPFVPQLLTDLSEFVDLTSPAAPASAQTQRLPPKPPPTAVSTRAASALLVSGCADRPGARVVVSRSFADFTPQATFDIKVGTNENH